MGSNNSNPKEGNSSGNSDKILHTTRRSLLRYAGVTAGGLGFLSEANGVAAASYETITVPAGQTQNILVDGTQTHENKLYDVTADGAGVTFRLMDNGTLRNVGIKGKNQSDRYAFRIGSGVKEVTIDRVYTEHFDENAKSIGGILATKSSSGTINVRGATIKGYGNDAMYFSKTDADVYVEDCYLVNNRTANYRGGGNYHGNNRDAIFRNCVCVIDDLRGVPPYPSGGCRSVGFLARWGTIEVHNSDVYVDPNAPDSCTSDGTILDRTYCMRADSNTGSPVVQVYDSDVNPRDRIGGNVQYVSNVGNNPRTQAPSYAPTSAEDAASGTSSSPDPSVAVSTGNATSVTDSSATLGGSLSTLGGASSADVAVQYRQAGASSWNAAGSQTISSTGSFSFDATGLSSGTDYEYRAKASASDGDTDTGSIDTFTASSSTSLSNYLRIDGFNLSSQVDYQITVSGDIVKGNWANPNDTVTGSTADGQVNGGQDNYDFSGEITDVQVSGDVPIYVNGNRLDLSQFQYPNQLKIDGSSLSSQVQYQITVSGDIVKGDYANDNDDVVGSTADGQVHGGIDTYDFSGEISDVQVDGDVPVYVNGNRLDLSQFQYPNKLKIDGSNLSSQVHYEITVSGEIVKGDYANDNDDVVGSTADGQVHGGIDTYDFSGEVTDVQIRKDVPIYVNGNRLDLSTIG